uniref:Uncharacterized protein n=1 Tax=Arundo donax TaxID=35708 RepID=A0A0A9A8X8_ARUDO
MLRNWHQLKFGSSLVLGSRCEVLVKDIILLVVVLLTCSCKDMSSFMMSHQRS